MASSDFFAHSIIILCFLFSVQLSGNSLKKTFFKKGCQNWVSIFCVLRRCFESSFFEIDKHYKHRGFRACLCFLLSKEKNKDKNDNWNFRVWVFGGPKMAAS